MSLLQVTLTRSSLVKSLIKETNLPSQTATAFLEAVIEAMILTLSNQESVKIAGFGSFNARYKSRRIGRNPKTKKEAIIKPRYVVLFTPSTSLKKKVQKKALKDPNPKKEYVAR